MAYNEQLNDRLRERMAQVSKKVEEKFMFGGVCYMVDGKMCVGIVKDDLMCRIGPDEYEAALEKTGCREMVFTGKPMKGYVFVVPDGLKTKKDLDYWVNLSLAFNDQAKSSKKTKKTRA
ncbi:MAG: TfoX/Sxy family protein [Bacteroidetes bacterium]|nr:TfoX/Sxy family protein [Bacteroidota bacterium]